MSYFSTTKFINADLEKVFDIVAHIENFSKAVSGITKIEYLSDIKRGVGTRFRETRMMGKRENTVDLEVTEYIENEKVRIVSDAGGAIWDTLFQLRDLGNSTCELSMVMDARPKNIASKLMVNLVKGKVASAVEEDMEAVKAYCEA